MMLPEHPPHSDDTSDVGDGEYLIRRFPSEPEYFQTDPPLRRLSWLLPNEGDPDGLSLNREAFISAEELLRQAHNINVRLFGGVLALQAKDVRIQHLNLVPDNSDTSGHVIIPEFSWSEYCKSKTIKNKIKALADVMVRKVVIRIHPTPKPLRT